jgi:hypothetical protein
MHSDIDDLMDKTKEAIPVTELKALLTTIIDNGRHICFRYRLLGEMWQKRFMRVLVRQDSVVIVHDETTNKAIPINLKDVMQFEIDGSIFGYKPHHHYDISSKSF